MTATPHETPPPRRGAAARARVAAERLHLLAFRHEMSHEMGRFLGNLSWSFVGGMLAAAIFFGFTVLAGRLLGPEEYGKVALVLVLSQLFGLLGAAGLDVASARLVPRAASEQARAELVTTAAVVVTGTLVVFALALLLARELIAEQADADRSLVLIAVAATLVFGLRTLFERQLGALELFRAQSGLKVLEGAVALAALGVVLALGSPSAVEAVLVLIGAAAVAIGGYVRRLGALLRRSALRRGRVEELWRYGRIALLYAIAPMGVIYGDRLVLNAQLGSRELGIYSAYYAASFAVVSQVLGGVTNVLFPAASRLDDKAALVAKLRRMRLLGTVPVAVGLVAVIYVVLLLFGGDYPFRLETAALFAAWGSIIVFNGLFNVVTITHSERAFLSTALFQGFRSVVFVAYLAALIALDRVSLTTIVAGMIGVEVVEALNLRRIVDRSVVGRPV